MNFSEIKEATAVDCEAFAAEVTKLAAQVREGDLDAFENFFFCASDEDGQSGISRQQELLLIRYVVRREDQGDSEDAVTAPGDAAQT